MSSLKSKTKRGDTLIEVMFAIAIFSLVAVISIAMMNAGVASAERSLELVTARNELNTQAEALRFIQSSYMSELNLRSCDDPNLASGEKCQQFESLWKLITQRAITASQLFEYPVSRCQDIYDPDEQNKLLVDTHAFIINPRALSSYNSNSTSAYIPATAAGTLANPKRFFEAPYNARLIYTNNPRNNDASLDNPGALSSLGTASYNYVQRVEGIWNIAVASDSKAKNDQPEYYDFYIETCWYGSGSANPSALDTVIRLANPEAK